MKTSNTTDNAIRYINIKNTFQTQNQRVRETVRDKRYIKVQHVSHRRSQRKKLKQLIWTNSKNFCLIKLTKNKRQLENVQ